MPERERSALRREDLRFITGKGRYTDDLKPAGMAHAALVRAERAHALIRSVSTDAARAAPGVVAVLTAADAEADGLATLTAKVETVRADGTTSPDTPRPLLAGGRVRHVGEPVVLVVAETRNFAEDAAELVEVDYDPLPAVAVVEQALASGAPALWESAPDNVAFYWRHGDSEAVEAAMRDAPHVVRAEIDISRVTAASLEPRTAVGAVEAGRLVLRSSHQSPLQLRNALARNVFGIAPEALQVLAGDVGGSFGMKAGIYREDVLVLWAARRLGRPVKWTSGRAEAFLSDEHARDANAFCELALDEEGRFLAFRVKVDANIGAYLSGRSLTPIRNIGGIAGVYRTPHIAAEVRGVFTNTSQTSSYRGAGRPEATYVLERTIDIAAHELGFDPYDLRMRNIVPADAMPYDTGFIFTYDCGDFAATMGEAARLADRAGFAERRSEARSRGKLRGLGIANPIEVAGGPVRKPRKDASRLTVGIGGEIILDCGVMSVGQGLETALTALAAEKLGIPAERISYRQGDSDLLAGARGSGGSSSIVVGGPAVMLAASLLIEKARQRAADALEASPVDIEYAAGAFRVAGTDRAVALHDLARSGDEPLSAEAEFEPEKVTFPNGCHICEVEIDPQTGKVEVVRYVAVEDIGTVLNPTLAAGQMHGGIAQGAGQALQEAIVHDENGELLTGSFNDYAMPIAPNLPRFRIAHVEVPTSVNPLGAKGVGEAGTVGALAATMNAVCDALSEVGGQRLDMPATANRVWTVIAGRARRTEV